MQIKIMANTYALTSAIKVGDIELLKKRNPAALKIKDKDGNDVFAVFYAEGKDSVSAYGITFGAKARDNLGAAVLTGTIPATAKTNEEAKAYVEEVLHAASVYLKALEGSVPAAAAKIAEDKATLMSAITVS